MLVEDMDCVQSDSGVLGNCVNEVIEDNLYDKIWVINLDSSTDRWKKATSYLDAAGLKYERFSAVNGYNIQIEDIENNKTLSKDEVKESRNIMKADMMYNVTCNPGDSHPTSFLFKGRNTAGELGLWCSYRIIWEDALAKKYKNIIIFEDDIKILNPAAFANNLDNFISNLPEFDFAFVNSRRQTGKEESFNSYINTVTSDYMGNGSDSVVHSARGIAKILSAHHFTRVVDIFIWSHQLGTQNINTGQVSFENYISSKKLVSTYGASILVNMGGRSGKDLGGW